MAREYTIGIPIATVIFLVLTVLAYAMLFRAMPSASELSAESAAVYEASRARAVAFIPPDNADPMTPNVEVESDEQSTIIRVYGLINPERQREFISIVREVRTELGARPVVVHFHYPLAVPLGADGEPLAPTVSEKPAPFRTERVTR